MAAAGEAGARLGLIRLEAGIVGVELRRPEGEP